MTAGSGSAPEKSWARLGLWIAMTYLGFSLAGGNHLVILGPTVSFDPSDIDASAAIVGFVFGAVAGAIIASLQWIVLRSWAPAARRWIPFTALGFGLAHLLNDAVPYRPLDLSWIILLHGVVIGVCQAMALRGTLARSWIWVPVASVAWIAGFTLATTLVRVIVGDPLAELFVAWGTAGLTIGLITGVALTLQIDPRTHELDRASPPANPS
jgi:hypothetical protein